MKTLKKMLSLAVLLVLLSSGIPSVAFGATNPVSYNPGIAAKYHAPISSVGILALDHAIAASTKLATGGMQASTGPSTIPQSSTRFINDTSYMPQSETTVSVDPTNPNHVVGGVNDGRYFFCSTLPSSDCPSGWTSSVTAFTVSADGGKTVLKGGNLPAISAQEYNSTSHGYVSGTLLSWGDPSLAYGLNGNFYFATLAIDPTTGANGIMVSESNANLWSSGSSCSTSQSAPTVNSCWQAQLVFGNLTLGPATFEDKDRIAVDTDPASPSYGSVYVTWDHFFADGTSGSYVAVCNTSLSCQMLAGGATPALSGNDPFAAFTTPAVGKDGTVHVTWCNYGTFSTFGPVSCRIRSSPSGGASFGATNDILSFMGSQTTLPADTVVNGYATEQMRTASMPNLAADRSSKSNNLYFAIEVCTSGHYYVFSNDPFLPADNPGNCGESSVVFSSSTNGGSIWSSPMVISQSGLNIQPYVTVDSQNGDVYVTHYTTQFDPFNHLINVVAEKSTDGGSSFDQIRITAVSNEPDSDPEMYAYTVPSGFGGSFSVPQYGDYFESLAMGGKLWVLYTGNYAVEEGTFQADPFLASGPASSYGNTIALAIETMSPVFPGQTVNVGADVNWGNGSAVADVEFVQAVILTPTGQTLPLSTPTMIAPGTFSLSATLPSTLTSGLYFVKVEANASNAIAFADGSFTVNSEVASASALGDLSNSLSSLQSSTSSALAGLQGGISSFSTSSTSALNALQSSVTAGFAGMTTLENSLSTINGTIGSALRSLNTSVGILQTAVGDLQSDQSGLSSTVSNLQSSVSSNQTYLLVLAAVTLIVVLVVLAMSLRRHPQGSPSPP